MIVEELIEQLKELDPKSEVYLQIDQEGNGYNKLRVVDGECVWEDETIYSLYWSAEDADLYEDEWEEIKGKNKCVVLSP